MCVHFLSDLGTHLLALNAGFTDLGGWGVAASDVHSTYHPLSHHVNDIIGVEMTKTLVPGIDSNH